MIIIAKKNSKLYECLQLAVISKVRDYSKLLALDYCTNHTISECSSLNNNMASIRRTELPLYKSDSIWTTTLYACLFYVVFDSGVILPTTGMTSTRVGFMINHFRTGRWLNLNWAYSNWTYSESVYFSYLSGGAPWLLNAIFVTSSDVSQQMSITLHHNNCMMSMIFPVSLIPNADSYR